jgi:16S rRNA (cytosine1402-N4)-methyltransferase
MMSIARERLAEVEGCDVQYVHEDYRAIPEVLQKQVEPGADAIFIDMGLNNAQIEDAEYGISFLREGPLDMRMDKRRETTAADWLNHATAQEIEDVLFNEGGERWARRIAATIVERRKTKPLATTTDLVDCVMAAIPAAKRDPRIHPATRTFQGVRIFINDELEDLGECVTAIAQSLRPGGTMVVLAYHSGEDGAVKHAFHALARTDEFSEPHRKPPRKVLHEDHHAPSTPSHISATVPHHGATACRAGGHSGRRPGGEAGAQPGPGGYKCVDLGGGSLLCGVCLQHPHRRIAGRPSAGRSQPHAPRTGCDPGRVRSAD